MILLILFNFSLVKILVFIKNKDRLKYNINYVLRLFITVKTKVKTIHIGFKLWKEILQIKNERLK